MSEQDLKLAYVASWYRVRLSIPHQACIASETVPQDFFDRAKAKLDEVRGQGVIDDYQIFDARAQECWRRFRLQKEPSCRHLILTLAQGYPKLRGFHLQNTLCDDALLLSIEADPEYLNSLRLPWIQRTVENFRRDHAIVGQAHPTQIKAAWLRALHGGGVVENVTIGPAPEMNSAKPFSILANKQRKEISLILYDVKAAKGENNLASLVGKVEESAATIADELQLDFHILKPDILEYLGNALEGPESLGIALPSVNLVALGDITIDPRFQGTASFAYPGKGLLRIATSNDRMLATIEDAGQLRDQLQDFKADAAWLARELDRHRIHPKASEKFLSNILALIESRATLNGVMIAEGLTPSPASDPYLDLGACDHEGTSEERLPFVRKGELIARHAYRKAGALGFDVFGNEIQAPDPEPLEVEVDDGVVARGSSYYAQHDGTPSWDGQKLSLNRVMVIEGDVNFRTGNILCEGPIEVRGSIDSNVIVQTSEDLVVEGMIRGALVRVKGNLSVGAGINTGDKGLIICGKEIECDFIENSRIHCRGSVLANKAIVNSEIVAGSNINVLNSLDGTIAGGSLSCKGVVQTGNLGFKNGKVTKMNIGVDWYVELALHIRSKRLKNIRATSDKDRMELREVLARTKRKRTAKMVELKEYYQSRLIRARAIIDKLEQQLQSITARLHYNPDSMILVRGKLEANVEIKIGGAKLPLRSQASDIAILARKRNGSKIAPYAVGKKRL